jgi:uncharacterized protein with HEPN domain
MTIGDKSIRERVRENREAILRIAAHHGARNVRLFGSVVRGDARSDSDVDLEAIEAVEQYTVAGRAEFMRSGVIHDATLHRLQALAESTQRLFPRTKAKRPEIDWGKIAEFRNAVVHEYLHLELQRAWAFIENQLPLLKTAATELLAELGSN